MAVRSTTARKQSFVWSKLAGSLSWFIGCYTTYLFLSVITDDAVSAPWGAVLLQLVFTYGERPIWYGEGNWYNFTLLAFDTVTNVGGTFTYITRLSRTDSWQAFATGLDMQSGLNPFAALILSIAIGALIAATPEFLWRQK